MGKRSRKRGDVVARPATDPPRTPTRATAPATPRATARRARLDELPQAPWAPFPLVEICVLIGLVLMGVGFLGGGDRKVAFILCGVALASLAGLEQAIREHFAGFRSHTTLLAGVGAVILLVGGTAIGLPRIAVAAAGLVVFGGVWYLLRRGFKRRSGGLGFRA